MALILLFATQSFAAHADGYVAECNSIDQLPYKITFAYPSDIKDLEIQDVNVISLPSGEMLVSTIYPRTESAQNPFRSFESGNEKYLARIIAVSKQIEFTNKPMVLLDLVSDGITLLEESEFQCSLRFWE